MPNRLMSTRPLGPCARSSFGRPLRGRYPGLLLFSEIFQVTGPIRRAAAMLASHGFVVAVPEIYHELEPAGTVLAYDEAGAERGNGTRRPRPCRATTPTRARRWTF